MKTNLFKMLALILVLIMAVAVFAACDEGEGQENDSIESSTDLSEGDAVITNDIDIEYYENGNPKKLIMYDIEGKVCLEMDYYENGVQKKETRYSSDNDWVKAEIYYSEDGKVTKEICEYDDYIQEIEYNSNGDILKYTFRKNDDNSVISHTDLEYDEAGNMIKESLYYGDDEVAFVYTEFSYNENGALKSEAKYYNSGAKHIYEYDVANNTNKHEHFFHFNDYYEYAVYTYSHDFGHGGPEPGILLYDMSVISAVSYADDGTLLRQAKREYDENGNYVLIDNIYNEDGSNLRDIIMYQNGELKEETFYYEDGGIRTNEYNENREKIQQTIIESNGDYTIIEYENGEQKRYIGYNDNGIIQYITETNYDEHGNISYFEEIEYDANGEISKITKYDANGNVIE